jgi:DNA polymerase III epsilon subunit-like protein
MAKSQCYVVLDTESSVCQLSFRRVLVSLAYEVVDVNASNVVRQSHYEIIRQPGCMQLDTLSESIHGITVKQSQEKGKPLADVLQRFLTVLHTVSSNAIVGHDIAGDIQLIVNEAIRVGVRPTDLGPLRRLLCTKLLSIAQCRLPLPGHLQYEYPCDVVLQTLNEHPPKKLSATYKFPSLEESYSHVVPLNDFPPHHHAHDARGDVERCRAVLIHLLLQRQKKRHG